MWLTRIDEMKSGDRFVAVGDGRTWTLDRPHASHGVFCCTREDGFASLFAGCAEGEVLEEGLLIYRCGCRARRVPRLDPPQTCPKHSPEPLIGDAR